MTKRQIAIAALVIGIVLALVSILADPLGVGGSQGFGWKQGLGLIVGLALIAWGAIEVRRRA